MQISKSFSPALITIMIGASLFCGCSDKSNPYTVILFKVYGSVRLHDAAGNSINSSGITVTLENTPVSGVTDSIGLWSLFGVKYGYQDVIFSKPGYFTIAQYWYEDGETINLPPMNMGTIPSHTVDSITATTSAADHSISFHGSLTYSDSVNHYIALLFTPVPIDTSAVGFFYYDETVLIPKNTGSFNHTMLIDNDFYWRTYTSPGDTISVIAYPLPLGAPFVDSAPDSSAYIWRNNSVRSSNVIQVAVP